MALKSLFFKLVVVLQAYTIALLVYIFPFNNFFVYFLRRKGSGSNHASKANLSRQVRLLIPFMLMPSANELEGQAWKKIEKLK